MTNWNEADHPRDDEGKFTYKGGGNSNSSNNSLSQKSNEEKMQNRANLLYDSMNEQMRSTDYSSAYKVYEDKRMQKDYDNFFLLCWGIENFALGVTKTSIS